MSTTQPFPLSQLNTCVPRQVLPKVAGKIVSVFKRHEGTNDKGHWSVQDIEIEGQGAKVKVKVWNKPEIERNDQGKHVEIMANEGKAGLTALFVEDDEYNGNTTRILRTTATAIFQIGGKAPQGDGPNMGAVNDCLGVQSSAAPNEPENQPTSKPPAQRQEPDAITETKRELMKLANLHLLATLTVEKYLAPEYKKATGREMPEDRRGASISSLIIAGERRGLHLALPTSRMKQGNA